MTSGGGAGLAATSSASCARSAACATAAGAAALSRGLMLALGAVSHDQQRSSLILLTRQMCQQGCQARVAAVAQEIHDRDAPHGGALILQSLERAGHGDIGRQEDRLNTESAEGTEKRRCVGRE
jgi:hypothetical protein